MTGRANELQLQSNHDDGRISDTSSVKGVILLSLPMIEKYESRRLRVQIRHVFLDTWDPIGIENEPNAQDEYDGYIGKVFELLVDKAPDEAIEDCLLWAVNDHMGLDAPRSAMKETVAALRRIQFPADSK